MLNKKFILYFIIILSLKAEDNITVIINQGTSEIEKILKETSIQKRYKKDRTLLHYAVKAKSFDIVSLLVRDKIILSIQGGNYNNTALQDAIFYGYLKIADYLIKKGTPLNIKNRYGQTALHIASSRGYVDTINLLLSYGADKKATDNRGETPYQLIPKLTFSNSKILKKLLYVNSNSYLNQSNIKNNITIDKKSKLENCHIGVWINGKE